MEFENSPEIEGHANPKKTEFLNPLETSIQVECPERQEIVKQAALELKTAFKTLGIENLTLPKIIIKFIKSDSQPVLGQVEIHDGVVEICYDQKFSSPQSEEELVKELNQSGKNYPGMKQTLKHELAHVAMWSVTGQQGHPDTRLIDEGWARLLENTDTALPLAEAKSAVRNGLLEEPELFNRCLDFSTPITAEENLNAAEYEIGQALLLWIHERFGKEKMVELIKKSPSAEKRDDDSTEFEFAPNIIDEEIHTTAPEYFKLLGEVKADNLTKEAAEKLAKKWEGKQFETALTEITGFKNIKKIKQEFLKWINE